MIYITRFLSLSCLLCALSSCMLFQQEIKFDPKITTDSSDIGEDNKVNVVVLDQRNEHILIGRRGDGIVDIASINTHQNLEEIVKNNVIEALKKKSFAVPAEKGKILKISIVDIEYKTFQKLFFVGFRAHSVLEVFVMNKNGNIIYNKKYRSGAEDDNFILAPFAEKNDKVLQSSFQNAINEMLTDSNLIESLKK